jgi:hypothetical protein
MSARGDLCQGIGLNATQVTGFHFCGKQFSTGRIDALTNHNKWLIKSYCDFFAR